MANSSGEPPAKAKAEIKNDPLVVHEVQNVLVASLIGAILLLIVLAVIASH
jgi:hypothetical protein